MVMTGMTGMTGTTGTKEYLKMVAEIVEIVQNAVTDSKSRIGFLRKIDVYNNDPTYFITCPEGNNSRRGNILLEFSNDSGCEAPPYQIYTKLGNIRLGWGSYFRTEGCAEVFCNLNKCLNLEKVVDANMGIWEGNGTIYEITNPTYSTKSYSSLDFDDMSYADKCDMWRKLITQT